MVGRVRPLLPLFGDTIGDKNLLEFSSRAYALCQEWFGEPHYLPNRPYKIVAWRNVSWVIYSPIFQCFYFPVRVHQARWLSYFDIGLHMYERFTWGMEQDKLIRRFKWFDKVMHYSTAYQIMSKLGYQGYARDYLNYLVNDAPGRLTLGEFKASHIPLSRWQVFFNMFLKNIFATQRPAEYWSELAYLVLELNELVEWSFLCKVVDCQDWSEWFSLLSTAQAERVRALLEV